MRGNWRKFSSVVSELARMFGYNKTGRGVTPRPEKYSVVFDLWDVVTERSPEHIVIGLRLYATETRPEFALRVVVLHSKD